jgi:hypothetical protein
METPTTGDLWIVGIAYFLISFGALMALLTVFRRVRRLDGIALMTISVLFGVVFWIMCALTVVGAWGPAALMIGVLFAFMGPFLMAPVVYLISADWGNLALFLVLTALMMAGGAGGIKAYEATVTAAAK